MLHKILNLFRKGIAKPTPFLLLGVIGIIFFSLVFFELLPDPTAGLGVAYAFLFILALFVVVAVDRLVVRKLRFFPVVYSEIIILLLLYIIATFSVRTTKLIVTTDLDHFVIVYTEGGKTARDFKFIYPFDKELKIKNKECIVLNKSLEGRSDIEIQPTIQEETNAWSGYSVKSDEVYLNGELVKVKIFWTGNVNADTDEFLTCLEQLKWNKEPQNLGL